MKDLPRCKLTAERNDRWSGRISQWSGICRHRTAYAYSRKIFSVGLQCARNRCGFISKKSWHGRFVWIIGKWREFHSDQFPIVSKVSQECVAFALLRSMIGPQNKNHPRVKSEVKNQLRPVHSLFPRRKVASFHIEFSLAACNVSLVLIGCCDHFDRATLNQNALYWIGLMTNIQVHGSQSPFLFFRKSTSKANKVL